MKPILLTAAGNPENQDRGFVFHDGSRIVLCVADGAGGLSGGGEAASIAVELVRQNAPTLGDADSCLEVLRKMDAAIAKDSIAGETTCALVIVTPQEIFGASVGDSGVWLIPQNGANMDLTHGQQRKPFIGSGSASPVSFKWSESKQAASSLRLMGCSNTPRRSGSLPPAGDIQPTMRHSG